MSSISLNLFSVLPWCTFLPIFPMASRRSFSRGGSPAMCTHLRALFLYRHALMCPIYSVFTRNKAVTGVRPCHHAMCIRPHSCQKFLHPLLHSRFSFCALYSSFSMHLFASCHCAEHHFLSRQWECCTCLFCCWPSHRPGPTFTTSASCLRCAAGGGGYFNVIYSHVHIINPSIYCCMAQEKADACWLYNHKIQICRREASKKPGTFFISHLEHPQMNGPDGFRTTYQYLSVEVITRDWMPLVVSTDG